MITENFTIPKKEGQTFEPIPENVYQAELLDITVKDAKGQYAKPGDKNFVFQFTLLAGKDKDGTDLRGRNIWDNFIPTFLYINSKGKNRLYQVIEAMMGRELTPEEEATYEAVKLNG